MVEWRTVEPEAPSPNQATGQLFPAMSQRVTRDRVANVAIYFEYISEKGLKSPMFALRPTPNPINASKQQIFY